MTHKSFKKEKSFIKQRFIDRRKLLKLFMELYKVSDRQRKLIWDCYREFRKFKL